MSVDVILPDHEEIVGRIRSAVELGEPKLDMVLQKASALFEGTMKMLLQHETHGSGLTAASIETRKEDELVYGVGSYTRGHILRFLDLGTGVYRTGKMIYITPKADGVLRWISKETGDVVYAMWCLVKGIIPFEFMFRTAQAHLSDIDEIMKGEIRI